MHADWTCYVLSGSRTSKRWSDAQWCFHRTESRNSTPHQTIWYLKSLWPSVLGEEHNNSIQVGTIKCEIHNERYLQVTHLLLGTCVSPITSCESLSICVHIVLCLQIVGAKSNSCLGTLQANLRLSRAGPWCVVYMSCHSHWVFRRVRWGRLSQCRANNNSFQVAIPSNISRQIWNIIETVAIITWQCKWLA